jgi:hypothetical protein
LIRPTACFVLLFPVLYKIHSLSELKDRIALLTKRASVLVASLLLFMLPLVTQLILWKLFKGEYLHYSYTQERFFFDDPQIFNFLFSFRKGWLVYSPVMAFSLVGILFLKRHCRGMLLFTVVYLVCTLYVLSSWWEWSYGGSYGSRAMIESYAMLVFPLASFFSWVWDSTHKLTLKVTSRVVLVTAVYLLIELNLFQIWQYKYGIIHYSGMNKRAYNYVFLKEKFSKSEHELLKTMFYTPNPDSMLVGYRDR